ncbi:MAG: CoA ester lyase [Myxococcales bacterium]|nr:CoA ester lyase [Myxococcales bacterium]
MTVDHRKVPIRPRRSMLYVPGSRGRALEKAAQLPADALIFDLEDAVLPEAKPEARTRVVDALRTRNYSWREKIVRVNRLVSQWGLADIQAVTEVPGLDALLLPKVEDPEEVVAVDALLERMAAPASLRLMVMIETPLGVLHLSSIAKSSPRLVALVVGTNDLEAELGARCTPDRRPILMALSQCVMVARAYHLAVIDGVYANLHDATGYANACRQGAELGFDGKTVVHPSQLEGANRAFEPSSESVARARLVIEAFEAARAVGQGVAMLDGRIIENLHVRVAERTLAMHRAIAESGDALSL